MESADKWLSFWVEAEGGDYFRDASVSSNCMTASCGCEHADVRAAGRGSWNPMASTSSFSCVTAWGWAWQRWLRRGWVWVWGDWVGNNNTSLLVSKEQSRSRGESFNCNCILFITRAVFMIWGFCKSTVRLCFEECYLKNVIITAISVITLWNSATGGWGRESQSAPQLETPPHLPAAPFNVPTSSSALTLAVLLQMHWVTQRHGLAALRIMCTEPRITTRFPCSVVTIPHSHRRGCSTHSYIPHAPRTSPCIGATVQLCGVAALCVGVLQKKYIYIK